jgi:WD40 repeat protein
MTTAEEFESGHADRVTVLHINFTSTRILTGSADHRIKVWERDSVSGEQTLSDTWTAHDADIRDVPTGLLHEDIITDWLSGEMAASDNGLEYCFYR